MWQPIPNADASCHVVHVFLALIGSAQAVLVAYLTQRAIRKDMNGKGRLRRSDYER